MVPYEKIIAYEGVPVFVGHYWKTGEPKPLAKNIACVDYSAGRNGALVTYRWRGEAELTFAGFRYQYQNV
jgi:hypothetical protein